MTENDGKLNQVRALLAKAEATDNPAEAEACNAMALKLMAKYGIDAALAAQREHRSIKPIDRIFDIPSPYASPKSTLLHRVVEALGCRAVTLSGTGRSKVHVFGMESDVEMVDMLYTSLLLQATHGAARVESETDHYGRATTRSARSSYLIGFGNTVAPRLLEAYSQAKAEAEKTPGTDLVLASRDLVVGAAVSAKYPSLRKLKVVVRNSGGYERGQAAGRKANIHNRAETGGGKRTALR